MNVSEITKYLGTNKSNAQTNRTTYQTVAGFRESNYGHEYWPKISNDGQWLIYGASTGCHPHYDCDYEIFIHELGKSGDRTRLTTASSFENWPDVWVGDVPGTQPTIALSKGIIGFFAEPGGSNPPEQTVTASSLAGLSLSGLAATESANWLTITVSGSGTSRSLVNKVSIAGLGNGTYSTTVTVTASSVSKTYNVNLTIADIHIKMNAGANSVPGWEADDNYVSGGSDYIKIDNFDLNNAVNPGPMELYQTVRNNGPTFTFSQVPNGIFTVRLHFADPAYIVSATSSTRAMNVTIEGTTVLQNYDIVAAAGRGHKVVIEEFVLEVTDGNGITIVFSNGNGNDSFVAGIEIIKGGTLPTTNPAFTLTSPKPGEVWAVGSLHYIEWIAQNADDAVLEYTVNNGKDWKSITTGGSIPNDSSVWGKFPWIVPNEPSMQVRVQIGTYFGEGVTKTGIFEITLDTISPQDPALVGFWSFEEGSGTSSADKSSNGNTATLGGTVQFTPSGKSGSGVTFGARSEYVQVGTNNWDAGKGTIMLWAYPESFSQKDAYYLFGHTTQPAWNNRIQLYITPDGNLNLGLGNTHTQALGIAALPLNTWSHVGLTWDGSNYVVYVDGVSKAQGSYAGLSTFNSVANIGNAGNDMERTYGFSGKIDEVQVYNKALSATEIQALMNKPSAGTMDKKIPELKNIMKVFPHPFQHKVIVAFTLNQQSVVKVKIYGKDGRTVVSTISQKYQRGTHTIEWDGQDMQGAKVQPGVYFYVIKGMHFVQRGKIIKVE